MHVQIIVGLLVLGVSLRPSSVGIWGDWVRVLEEAARNQPPPLTLEDVLAMAAAEREGKVSDGGHSGSTLGVDPPEANGEGREHVTPLMTTTPRGEESLRSMVDRDEGPFFPTTESIEPSTDCGVYTATLTITAPSATVTVTAPGEVQWETRTVFEPQETHRETVTITSPPTTQRETVIRTAPPVTVRETMTMTDTLSSYHTQTKTVNRWQTATVTETIASPVQTIIHTETVTRRVTEPVYHTVTVPPQTMTATTTVMVPNEAGPLIDSTSALIRDEADRLAHIIMEWTEIVEPLLYAVCACCCWLVIIVTAHLIIVICRMRRCQAPNIPNIDRSPTNAPRGSRRPPPIIIRPPPIIRRRPGGPENIELRRT